MTTSHHLRTALIPLLRFKILRVWHCNAGPCSLSCHGDTIRQWYRTDFRISLHNPHVKLRRCQGRDRANCVRGRLDGAHVHVFVSGNEWEGKDKTEMEMGWEGLGEGTKQGGRRMTGRGMNDGDNEWETQTVTRPSRTIVRARPPAKMTGVRTCEWAGWVRGWRDAATVQLRLPSVWSLQPALRGAPRRTTAS